QQVTVTITGTDDASVIAGTFTGSVTEDGILVASGSLTITDPDLSDNPSFSDVPNISGDNGFGTFTLTSGVWTYTLDNNHPSVQALNNGDVLTDTITFTATDGSTQQISITINGTNEGAIVTQADTNTIDEDGIPNN